MKKEIQPTPVPSLMTTDRNELAGRIEQTPSYPASQFGCYERVDGVPASPRVFLIAEESRGLIVAALRTPSVADGEIARLKNRIEIRLNDCLCEMKPGWDDSMVGFNEAWDIVRKVFAESPAPPSDGEGPWSGAGNSFRNEALNKINIHVGRAGESVTYTIAGPDSTVENTLTVKEATELVASLSAVLDATPTPVEAMRRALAPFAKRADEIEGYPKSDFKFRDHDTFVVQLGDLRRAREALSSPPAEVTEEEIAKAIRGAEYDADYRVWRARGNDAFVYGAMAHAVLALLTKAQGRAR